MSDTRHWIWLQSCIGVAKSFDEIIEYFGSIERLYDSNYLQRKMCPGITDKILDAMETTSLESADKIISECKANNWDIITYEDDRYPNKLKNIYDPPAVLYVDGDLPNVDDYLTIGVVGTRKPSNYAKNVAKVISKGIARCGGIVISGGALGIDTSAHNGALSINGKTIAVLGCGLGSNYLATNEDLRRMISMSGALVSEYPPFTPASRFTFPPRNRIISGLCDGVFVAEASFGSGSLITANYATEQNRDLFAVTASIFDKKFNGTNRLIADGATPVVSVESIVSLYKEKYRTLKLSMVATVDELINDEYKNRDITPDEDEEITFESIASHREARTAIDEKARMLEGDEKKVYEALTDSFEDIEVISTKSALDINSVLVSLTMLELDGLAESGMGKRYRRKQS